MAGEHPRREDQDTALSADGTIGVGAREHQEGFGRQPGQRLESFALRVRLLEHRRIDLSDVDATAMALRLDREQAAGTNEDVVDVPAPEGDVVERSPTV